MRIAVPDLLASRKGRLTAFFLLYVTEGIPLGFTATAIAAQMRRQGLGPAAIGAFVGSLYLPWAFKWAVGPFVDVFSSDRFGRRRSWIFCMQLGMCATLLIAMGVDFVHQLALFTAIVFVHNAFGATQDVAIDGSGVLFLTGVMPFGSTYVFVVGTILAITLFVVVPLREKAMTAIEARTRAASSIGRELTRFVREAWTAFTGSRAALVGVFAALLPAGAYALSLALQSNLAVELGLDDNEIAQLNLISTVVFAPFCIVGGWVSDRFGRRSSLALFAFLTVVPTLWLAYVMWQAGWIMPVDLKTPNRPHPSTVLVVTYWATVIVYNVFQGLYYGIRTALYMDVTIPAVAATQFTAYMALLNLCISYTAWWQGHAVEALGYPLTLVLDCVFGMSALVLLPLMRPRRTPATATAAATSRATA